MMWACRECGTNISAEAEVCPRCGLRLKPAPVPPRPPGIGSIALGVFFGLLMWSCFVALMGTLMAGWIVQQLSAGMAPQP